MKYGWFNFAKNRPVHRSVLLLSSLRKESIHVLYCLGVWVPHYDVDDLYDGPTQPRPRKLRTEVTNVPRFCDLRDYPKTFTEGYDINDVAGKNPAAEINSYALNWRNEAQRVREQR